MQCWCKGHLCCWSGVGGLQASAEEAFPVPRQDNTRPGGGRELPATSPRGNAPAGSGSCCSLFLLFDLQHVWSPAGSLSWPQHCLITCSKGCAEEEAKHFPGWEGLDEVGDVWTLLGMKPAAWNGGCQHGARMFPGEVEWVPSRSWDDPEGVGIWDVHRLWMGWQRSGRAPESIPVTSGKCFISAQLDSAPNPVHWAGGGRLLQYPAQAWPGPATAALLAPWGQGEPRAGGCSAGAGEWLRHRHEQRV